MGGPVMRKHSFLLLPLISLFLVIGSYAQNSPRLVVRIINPKIEAIFVSDLDVLQLAEGNDFFIIGIFNPSDQTFRGNRLVLRFLKDGKLIARAESEPFSIPSLTPGKFATNVDLASGFFNLSDENEPEYNIRFRDSKIVTDQVENLEQNVLSSGKVPVGRYRLEAILEGAAFGTIDEKFDEFVITNPSFVQLVSPGKAAGFGLVEEIYSEFPVFQWNGNGREYQVLVFEKKYRYQTLDNVLNSTPNWVSEPLQGLSAQYPQSSGDADGVVIPLQYGKTYYWMVKMFVATSAGKESINSEIWEFKLVDPMTLGTEQGKIARNELIEFLRDLLGPRAEELAKQLADYNVKRISVNGREISIQELYQLINEYRTKNIEVFDVILPTGSN